MLRDLVRISAKIRDGHYDYAMIIKSIWSKAPEVPLGPAGEEVTDAELPKPFIDKDTKRMMLCRAEYNGERLVTTMFKTPSADASELPEAKTWKVSEGKAWRNFSYDDVIKYVDAVGDPNPLHRSAHPVVPGMCLMEAVLESLPPDITELALSFRAAVFTDEDLLLKAEDGKVELYGREVFINGTYK